MLHTHTHSKHNRPSLAVSAFLCVCVCGEVTHCHCVLFANRNPATHANVHVEWHYTCMYMYMYVHVCACVDVCSYECLHTHTSIAMLAPGLGCHDGVCVYLSRLHAPARGHVTSALRSCDLSSQNCQLISSTVCVPFHAFLTVDTAYSSLYTFSWLTNLVCGGGFGVCDMLWRVHTIITHVLQSTCT